MKNMIRQVVQINSALGRQLEKRNHRSVQATGAACVGNLFIGIGKLLLGIISLSFFTCVSAAVQSRANGLMGVLMGSLAAIMGLLMMIRMRGLQKTES